MKTQTSELNKKSWAPIAASNEVVVVLEVIGEALERGCRGRAGIARAPDAFVSETVGENPFVPFVKRKIAANMDPPMCLIVVFTVGLY